MVTCYIPSLTQGHMLYTLTFTWSHAIPSLTHGHMYTVTFAHGHTGTHVRICRLNANSHTHKLLYRIFSNRTYGI